jgi:phosphopantetheinyl transferase
MKTANRLRKYRQQCERETKQSSGDISVSLHHVLADVCRVLKISPRQQRRVLGRRGSVQLSDMRRWCVSLSHSKSPRKP